MSPKLIKSLLIASALGFFILWILEFMRTDLGNSYWLLMFSLTFLLGYQYYRLRTQPKTTPKESATQSGKRTTRPPKRRKKK